MRTDTGHRIYIHNTNCSLVKSNGTTQHTLRLRVTHGSNRIDLRTRIRVEPKLWDKRKQRLAERSLLTRKWPWNCLVSPYIIEEGHKFYINSAINLFCCRIYIIFAPKSREYERQQETNTGFGKSKSESKC